MNRKGMWLGSAMLALVLMFGGTGCWLLEGGPQKAERNVNKALKMLDDNLPVAKENAAITASKLQGLTEKAEGLATVAGTLPGPQQPYVKGAAVLLGLATTVLSWVATKLKRKTTVTELALDSVIVAVNEAPGIGGRINRVAVSNGDGAADKVKERYDVVIPPKLEESVAVPA